MADDSSQMSNTNTNANYISAKANCKVCGKDVKTFVTCIKCNVSYHHACALRVVGLCVDADGIICCKSRPDDAILPIKTKFLTSSSPTVYNSISPLEAELMKKLIAEMEDKNTILVENKQLLEQQIVALRQEIDVKKTDSTILHPFSGSTSIEAAVHEFMERGKKQNNVVLFNAKEDKQISKEQRENADKLLIENLLGKLAIPSTTTKFEIQRLGKFNITKTELKRPLKIVFLSREPAEKLLRTTGKLKDCPMFGHINIARDQTPLQAKLYASTKLELNRRKLNGETNIRIKFKDGAPYITQSEN